jgi:hypothetical protein
MKKTLIFILAFTMMISFVTNVSASNSALLEKNANSLVKLGIMKGYEDGTLKLNIRLKEANLSLL